MYKFISIQSDNEDFEITALIKEDKYVSPILTIHKNTEDFRLWDNKEYLIKEFYPKLILYKQNKQTLVDELGLLDNTTDDVLIELLQMFNEAVRMGIFKI